MRKLILANALCLIVLAGCSTATSERLKAFFFEIPEEESASRVEGAPGQAVAETPTLVLPESKYKSVHPPYLERGCDSCHNSANRMQVREDILNACSECHDRYFSAEVGHSPVAEGQCTACHDPHRSTYANLLKQATFDTCIDCHDEPEDLSEKAHGTDGVESCTKCHDPHFGTGSLLKTSLPGSTRLPHSITPAHASAAS